MLWPAAQKALRRTRRSIRVDPLRLSVTLGGAEDPARPRSCTADSTPWSGPGCRLWSSWW